LISPSKLALVLWHRCLCLVSVLLEWQKCGGGWINVVVNWQGLSQSLHIWHSLNLLPSILCSLWGNMASPPSFYLLSQPADQAQQLYVSQGHGLAIKNSAPQEATGSKHAIRQTQPQLVVPAGFFLNPSPVSLSKSPPPHPHTPTHKYTHSHPSSTTHHTDAGARRPRLSACSWLCSSHKSTHTSKAVQRLHLENHENSLRSLALALSPPACLEGQSVPMEPWSPYGPHPT
jgi:hypothetical protein